MAAHFFVLPTMVQIIYEEFGEEHSPSFPSAGAPSTWRRTPCSRTSPSCRQGLDQPPGRDRPALAALVAHRPRFALWLRLVAGGLGPASIALLLGGGPREALAATGIGLAVLFPRPGAAQRPPRRAARALVGGLRRLPRPAAGARPAPVRRDDRGAGGDRAAAPGSTHHPGGLRACRRRPRLRHGAPCRGGRDTAQPEHRRGAHLDGLSAARRFPELAARTAPRRSCWCSRSSARPWLSRSPRTPGAATWAGCSWR